MPLCCKMYCTLRRTCDAIRTLFALRKMANDLKQQPGAAFFTGWSSCNTQMMQGNSPDHWELSKHSQKGQLMQLVYYVICFLPWWKHPLDCPWNCKWTYSHNLQQQVFPCPKATYKVFPLLCLSVRVNMQLHWRLWSIRRLRDDAHLQLPLSQWHVRHKKYA